MRKSRVLVVQHAGLPRPLHAVHHRGEAVHHHQQGGAAGISARVQFGVDARVVRRVDRIDALLPLRCRQPDIGWHHGVVAHFRNQRGRGQRTVAVDQQPRIGLFDRPGIEPFGQCAGGAGNADVPADVAVQFGLRQAQAGEGTRYLLAGVVGQQQERRGAPRLVDRVERRVVSAQQRRERVQVGVSHERARPGGARSSTGRPTAWHPARSLRPFSAPATLRPARAESRAR
ncbi:hypothetical protein G6F23_013757 [Rhizopus arrhizus]|nr:hypothetical protein G6F23_013757 [Rhizopus arrhizus]